MLRTLRTEGLEPAAVRRVTTAVELQTALDTDEFHLVLCDFSLPSFSGREALRMVRQQRPDLPFVFVTGTLGEERAVESMRAGATDIVFKDRLERLGPVLRRTLREAGERRRNEERIREQAELLDTTQEAILVEALETGRLTYANGGAARLYGLELDALIGARQTDLGVEQDADQIAAARRETLARGAWTGLLRQRTHSGRDLQVQSNWTLVRHRNGEPKSFLVVNTDVTELKELEKTLLRNQRLESIGELAGGIAHDLNNVLAPIQMAAELLRPRVSDPRAERFLDIVEESARRGARLIRQILTFARGTDGERVPFDPRALVEEVWNLAVETFPKSIRFEHRLASTPWPISGQPNALHQVLLNLCVNARDAMPEGGVLSLELENVALSGGELLDPEALAGRYLVFRVKDSGVGIPAAHQERIFDPYFTTKPIGKGTGLGLATARSILRSHGGFISFRSAPGDTCFELYLPAGDQRDAADAVVVGPAPGGHGDAVLVVDDERSVLDVVEDVLVQHGYRVLRGHGGVDGARVLAEHAAELAAVVTDLGMAELDGTALVARVRALREELPVIMTTGLVTAEALQSPGLANVTVVPKPYTARALLDALDAAIRPGRGEA